MRGTGRLTLRSTAAAPSHGLFCGFAVKRIHRLCELRSDLSGPLYVTIIITRTQQRRHCPPCRVRPSERQRAVGGRAAGAMAGSTMLCAGAPPEILGDRWSVAARCNWRCGAREPTKMSSAYRACFARRNRSSPPMSMTRGTSGRAQPQWRSAGCECEPRRCARWVPWRSHQGSASSRLASDEIIRRNAELSSVQRPGHWVARSRTVRRDRLR